MTHHARAGREEGRPLGNRFSCDSKRQRAPSAETRAREATRLPGCRDRGHLYPRSRSGGHAAPRGQRDPGEKGLCKGRPAQHGHLSRVCDMAVGRAGSTSLPYPPAPGLGARDTRLPGNRSGGKGTGKRREGVAVTTSGCTSQRAGQTVGGGLAGSPQTSVSCSGCEHTSTVFGPRVVGAVLSAGTSPQPRDHRPHAALSLSTHARPQAALGGSGAAETTVPSPLHTGATTAPSATSPRARRHAGTVHGSVGWNSPHACPWCVGATGACSAPERNEILSRATRMTPHEDTTLTELSHSQRTGCDPTHVTARAVASETECGRWTPGAGGGAGGQCSSGTGFQVGKVRKF